MKYAFGTVVYKAALNYIDAFCDSINAQNYNNYEILIINDDLEENEIVTMISKLNRHAVVIKGIDHASPAVLRCQLIKYAYFNDYDLLILGDADDTFKYDRIHSIVEKYETNKDVSFFYNDLRYLDSDSRVFIDIPERLNEPSDLVEYNFVGLSNSAINLKKIDNDILNIISFGETAIFDWYLYSVILSFKGVGLFVPKAVTYYRIHENNTVGVLNNKYKDYEIEYSVKLRHYSLLKELDVVWYNALSCYQTLDLMAYYNQDNTMETNSFWWSKIKIL